MIFVKRDPTQIPEELLERAEKAQTELERTPSADRVAFIKKNAKIWREFADHLKKMSYGKCWYSESDDPQAFFDVDHFRPKARARRSEKVVDDGYPWLAFSFENFRLSAQRSNRLNTDEEEDEVVGKGDWFPLESGSRIATWDNRCVDEEKPVLLDPTVKSDVGLIDVDGNGRICAGRYCYGADRARVDVSIKIYGLNLPAITEARQRVMRDAEEAFDMLERSAQAADKSHPLAEDLAVKKQLLQLKEITMSNRRFARAARSMLFLLGHPELCAGPEDTPAH